MQLGHNGKQEDGDLRLFPPLLPLRRPDAPLLRPWPTGSPARRPIYLVYLPCDLLTADARVRAGEEDLAWANLDAGRPLHTHVARVRGRL